MNSLPRVIVQLIVYNEEEYLNHVLCGLDLIRDLDEIMILDGAFTDSPERSIGGLSRDATKSIVQDYQNHGSHKLTFIDQHRTFENEPIKRNVLFNMAPDDAWILALDGDEILDTPGPFKLKPYFPRLPLTASQLTC